MNLFTTFISEARTGAWIGFLSFVIGIIGLIITIITMVKATKIETHLFEEKAKAIDKKRFVEYKNYAIASFSEERQAAYESQRISHQRVLTLIGNCKDVLGFDGILMKDDRLKLESILKNSEELSQNYNSKSSVGEYVSIYSDLINILKKGAYDI